jgi:hypothetical protein
MNNLHIVLLIMFGTYVCAAKPEAFVTELGEFDWSLGVVMAIAMFGALSLLDLAFVGAKHAYAIGCHLCTKWRLSK